MALNATVGRYCFTRTGNGEIFILSPEDKDLLEPSAWCNNPSTGYVFRRFYTGLKYINEQFHKVIGKRLGFNLALEIDHINRVRLDNRRENLRPALRGLNAFNRSVRKDSTTGFRGIEKHGKGWRVHMNNNTKTGVFNTLAEAQTYRQNWEELEMEKWLKASQEANLQT